MLVIDSVGWWCITIVPCAVEVWQGLMLQSMLIVLCTRPLF